jgi:hypothetical protein
MAETFDPFALPSAFEPVGADALPALRGRPNTAKAASAGQAGRPAPPPLPRLRTGDVTTARLANFELAVTALTARLDALEEATQARLTELEDNIAARLDDQMGRLVRTVATMLDARLQMTNVDGAARSTSLPPRFR